jgi:MFS family permease
VRQPDRLLSPRFVLVVVVGLAYFLALGALLPTVPLLVKHEMGGSDLLVGIAVGSFALGAVLVRPWAGRLGDRFGRRPLVIGGPAVVGLSVASYHLAAVNPTGLVIVRLMGGLGEAAMFVGAGTMITDLAPEHRRGEALSYWSVAIYGGLAFGPALGEAVLGPDDAFGRVWTVCAGLLLAAAALALATKETLTPPRPGEERTPAPLLHRAALLPGLVLFLVMVGLAGFLELVPLYVPEVGLADSKAVFLVYGTSVLAVRILGARIPDRAGPRLTASVGSVLTGTGLAIIAAWAHPAGLFAGALVFALGMSLVFPAISTLSMAGVPAHERGAVMGTTSTFFDAAQGIGSAWAGLLAGLTSYRGAFFGGAAASFLAWVVLRTRVTERPTVPASDAVALAVATGDAPV